VREGVARAHWPGRFEVRRRPGGWLVLDGAHNPAGARALAESLAAYFGDTPMTLVFGVLRDKDAPGILAPLLGRTRRVVLTASANPRAASADELRRLVPSGVPVDVVQSVGDALACAADPAVPLVCVAGSLSLIGDALRSLAGGDTPCSVEIPDI